jgi:hypothetical protein
VNLDGLKVVAVVKADNTLGDVHRFPQQTQSVLIVDEKATPAQREALVHFAHTKAADVLGQTVQVDVSPVSVQFPAACTKGGCANVRAGDLVEIETRCMGGKDHICGNEEMYYPPLTDVSNAHPAFTLAGMFHGDGLGIQFDAANRRSAYIGTFGE